MRVALLPAGIVRMRQSRAITHHPSKGYRTPVNVYCSHLPHVTEWSLDVRCLGRLGLENLVNSVHDHRKMPPSCVNLCSGGGISRRLQPSTRPWLVSAYPTLRNTASDPIVRDAVTVEIIATIRSQVDPASPLCTRDNIPRTRRGRSGNSRCHYQQVSPCVTTQHVGNIPLT